jgi:hypothetical protein
MVSSEYHAPYYEVLTQLGLNCKNPKFTFVTHHMLFDPKKFHSILNFLGITSIDELLFKTIEVLSKKRDVSICVEFELYAQGLIKWFPEYVHLQRFGNLGVSVKGFKSELKINEPICFDRHIGYNSLSIHSWS